MVRNSWYASCCASSRVLIVTVSFIVCRIASLNMVRSSNFIPVEFPLADSVLSFKDKRQKFAAYHKV